MADAKQKRNEQLQRWLGSETDLEPPVLKKKKTKVKFDDGAVFLAACSSGDTEEVLRLLDRGADINYANVDGLTALHQVGCAPLPARHRRHFSCVSVVVVVIVAAADGTAPHCSGAKKEEETSVFARCEQLLVLKHLSNGSHSHPRCLPT